MKSIIIRLTADTPIAFVIILNMEEKNSIGN